MAVAVGATATSREIRVVYRDTAGEEAPVTYIVQGTTSNADIATFVDNLSLASNAYVTAEVTNRYAVTGIDNDTKPLDEAPGLVAAILAMEFSKANPLNATKVITKQALLPDYDSSLRNDAVRPVIPVDDNVTLNAITAFLATNLDYVAINDTHYPGSWTYNPNSRFGTKATVTDGF